MDTEELDRIADAWIAGEEAKDGTSEREENWWAIERVMNWSLGGESESLWEFILIAYQRELSEKAMAVLAAGPLEDLLAHHGANYIDRIEKLARQDAKFNRLLGGVWQNSMTDEVWKRVQSSRKEVW